MSTQMSTLTSDQIVSSYGLVPRPQSELFDLPINFRWEFTRRHPYYLRLWREARRYRRQEIATGDEDVERGFVAMRLLGLIGITGEPEDPAKAWDELGGFDPCFLSGVVQPMTFRNMVDILIAALPRLELRAIMSILTEATDTISVSEDEQAEYVQRLRAQGALNQIPSQALDSYPLSPLFYVYLEASQRRIVEDIEEHVRRWKQRRGISERRVHVGKLADYLKIWDLREGWHDGAYNVDRENTFQQIARQIKASKSTVANGYRAAFQRLTGHEFRPDLWLLLMGPQKLPQLNNTGAQLWNARYRRLKTGGVTKPAPETRVQPRESEHGRTGLVESESATDDGQQLLDMLIDFETLIDRGLPDDQIATKLGLAELDVAYLRTRLAELSDLR
jgi:hypothetical protein